MDERDTHFKNFAKLLIERLESIHALHGDVDYDTLEPLIARAAYDLFYSSFTSMRQGRHWYIIHQEGYGVISRINDLPDMTAWPNEAEIKADKTKERKKLAATLRWERRRENERGKP